MGDSLFFLLKKYTFAKRKKYTKMINLSEENFNLEWGTFASNVGSLGLNLPLDELKEAFKEAPGALSEDTGIAYPGALLVHINLANSIADRLQKMVSGTFKIDEASRLKVCMLMHLSKIEMYTPNSSAYWVKNGKPYEFNPNLEAPYLKFGDRSIILAMKYGITFTPTEYDAMKCLENEEKKGSTILSTIIRQANELAYAIEKERYNKNKN